MTKFDSAAFAISMVVAFGLKFLLRAQCFWKRALGWLGRLLRKAQPEKRA